MSRGIVLVTGASSGIGEAFARLFAQEGFQLILTARRLERLQALQSELGPDSVLQVISEDLAAAGGAQRLIAAVQHPLDILVNNAGTMTSGEFTDLEPTAIEQVIQVNITALTLLTRHYAAAMRQRGQGRILNVASVAAFHPVPGMDIYAATKAYVLSLTEALAENLRNSGVSVSALCPGLTMTEMADPVLAEQLPAMLRSTPEDVAREGYTALMNREVVRVPGDLNKLALAWAQHQPRWLVRGLGGLAARLKPTR